MKLRHVLLASLVVVLTAACATVEIVGLLRLEELAVRVTVDADLALKLKMAAAGAAFVLASAGIALFSTSITLPFGTRGRSRLSLLGLAAIFHAHVTIVAYVSLGELPSGDFAPYADPWNTTPTAFALGFTLLTLGLLVLCTLSVWFLVPIAVRRVTWIIIDALDTLAAVGVTVLLPIAPPADNPSALLFPSIRIAVTVLFAARLIARMTGPILSLFELIGARFLIAARFIRTGRSGFVTVIGGLSILAVAVSSCTLTTTLSIMGGFRADLKRKILGNQAHITIDHEPNGFEGWEPVMHAAERVPGVTAASPFVLGEVMLSSVSNHTGAILHGIDPETIGHVTDLERDMRSGQLRYLDHPDEATATDDFGAPLSPTVRGPHGLLREFGDGIHGPVPGVPPSPVPLAPPHDVPSLPKDEDDLAPFLISPDPTVTPASAHLPGIIVGQELARSLRLFVGDEVTVVTPHGDLGPMGPVPKARSFRVVGIFYTGMFAYDNADVYVSLEVAQELMRTGGAVSGIALKVRDIDQAPQVARAVSDAIHRSGLRVRDWQAANSQLFGALQLEKLAMFIALGIAIVVAGFCVLATLMLLVQEKQKQVAILKAMGTRDSQVAHVFLLQGAFIGVYGAAMGLGLGYVMCFVAQHFGIRMETEVYYIDQLPVHMDPVEFGAVAIVAIVVCTLAALGPALRPLRLNVIEALRGA